jgi:CheY-like chemotaxis protein
MNPLRILHVDDEPDIREVVQLSLALDSAFSVRSCASGVEALAAAADWSPDIILCDVMMPVMDGLATLVRLRECPQTVDTPVVFMTARAQAREIEHFKSLGANGVIAKPFDPLTLAYSIRCQLRSARLAASSGDFAARMRVDAATLAKCGAGLWNEATATQVLEHIKVVADGLVGSAGIFGFAEVGDAALVLESTAINWLNGNRESRKIEDDLDALQIAIEEALRQEPLMH